MLHTTGRFIFVSRHQPTRSHTAILERYARQRLGDAAFEMLNDDARGSYLQFLHLNLTRS